MIKLLKNFTTGHFYIWGTGIPGFSQSGISGLALGEDDVGEEATDVFGIGMSMSQIIVIGEWLLVFFLAIFVYTRSKIDFKREVKDLEIRKVGLRKFSMLMGVL